MRRHSWIPILLAFVCGLLIPTSRIDAACASNHWLVSSGGPYFSGAPVVSNPDWGGVGGDGSCASYGCYADESGPPVGAGLTGFFWALGTGDPGVGLGDDNGARAGLPDWVDASTYPSYPLYYYPAYFDRPGWTTYAATPVDGCVLNAGATSGNDGTECMALMLGDSWNDAGYFAAVTSQIDGGGLFPSLLDVANPLVLQSLPLVHHDAEFGEPFFEEHSCSRVQVFPPTIPSSALELDANCDDPLVGFKVYAICVPRGAAPPTDRIRDDGNPATGWELAGGGGQTDGAAWPLDASPIVDLGCSTTQLEDGYLALSLVFDSSFETPYVSANSVRAQCCIDADEDGNCLLGNGTPSDCDDADPAVGWGMPQLCDGLNNECGHPAWPSLVGTNEFDDDGDGASECAGDCNDADPTVSAPGFIADTCNGRDDNCDGRFDESPLAWFAPNPGIAGAPAHYGFDTADLDDVETHSGGGSGYSDFAVGARWEEAGGQSRAGRVVIHGGINGWPVLGRLQHPTPDVEDSFGAALAPVADLNGDGLRDLLVGAYQDDVPGSVDAGSAFLFSGSLADGFTLIGPIANPAPAAGDEFGYSVVGLDDVDNDGFADMVVGARGDDGKGSAFVISGQTRLPLGKLEDPAGNAGDLFGYRVARLDDLDGDGKDEVLVGAYEADSTVTADAGQVYLFSGATRALIRTLDDPTGVAGDQLGRGLGSIEDLNGDGWSDVLVGAPGRTGKGEVLIFSGFDGTVIDRIIDIDGAAGDAFGDRVIALDDVDGDGVQDIAVSATFDDTAAGVNAGTISVYSGATRTRIGRYEDPAGQAGALLGRGLSRLTDLDLDGIDDFIVGAYLQDTAEGTNHGAVRVFHGAWEQDPDGDLFGNACDDDDDGDAVPDAADCAPLDARFFELPDPVDSLYFSAGADNLRWISTPDVGYDIFRADLGPGAGLPPATNCVARRPGGNFYFDTDVPLAGRAFGYLVRGTNPCGVGTLGDDSSGSERTPAMECP